MNHDEALNSLEDMVNSRLQFLEVLAAGNGDPFDVPDYAALDIASGALAWIMEHGAEVEAQP